MLRNTAIVCFALVSALAVTGCEDAESAALDPEVVGAGEYVDGTSKLSDTGAFEVELWSDAGEAVIGSNTFVARVTMSETDQGIPNADVHMDAFMPMDDVAMGRDPTITYLGDGQYQFDGVELSDPGVWQLDISIAVGETMRESVTFAFDIEG